MCHLECGNHNIDPFEQLHRILTGFGRDCIEMREVSPMGGLLPEEERIRVLRTVR